MTNIEKWPEAFEHGIPKVGGRWEWRNHDFGKIKAIEGGRCVRWDDNGWSSAASVIGDESFTFLGFSDSAPVNQGAAAPQKPGLDAKGEPIVGTCWEAQLNHRGAEQWIVDKVDRYIHLRRFENGAWCRPGRHSWAVGSFTGQDPPWTLIPDPSNPAPIAASPPSREAAVQQEGLAILPQTGTRHEVFEAAAQKWEGAKQFNLAGQNMKQARAALDADLAYDAEADAIRENRIVRKAALQEMGRGDRECFKLRNLREFEAIKSAEHAMYFWWKS